MNTIGKRAGDLSPRKPSVSQLFTHKAFILPLTACTGNQDCQVLLRYNLTMRTYTEFFSQNYDDVSSPPSHSRDNTLLGDSCFLKSLMLQHNFIYLSSFLKEILRFEL